MLSEKVCCVAPRGCQSPRGQFRQRKERHELRPVLSGQELDAFISLDTSENRSCQLVGDQLIEIKDEPKMCYQNALLFTPPSPPGTQHAADYRWVCASDSAQQIWLEWMALSYHTSNHQEGPADQVQINVPLEECLQYITNHKVKWPLSQLKLSSVHSIFP